MALRVCLNFAIIPLVEEVSRQSPLMIGLRSVKANALPMFVLWCLAVVLVLAYYRIPSVASVLNPLERVQSEYGVLAAFMNRVIFCGALPGAFMLCVKSLRPPRVGLVILAYCLWGGVLGVLFDWFCMFQVELFGTGTDWPTLIKKTALDQFVWNVLICTPAGALFFAWVSRDFHWRAPASLMSFVKLDCLTILVSNWMVWIPVMLAVYAFPTPLQIQLVGLASSFWMLVALKVGGSR